MTHEWQRYMRNLGRTDTSPTHIAAARKTLELKLAEIPTLKPPLWEHSGDLPLHECCPCNDKILKGGPDRYDMLPIALYFEWPSPNGFGEDAPLIVVCGCGTVQQWNWD